MPHKDKMKINIITRLINTYRRMRASQRKKQFQRFCKFWKELDQLYEEIAIKDKKL